MSVRQLIEVKLEFSGLHRWPGAPEHVSYLSVPHRHLFKIVARKLVTHSDRDIEFITLKHQMECWVASVFPTVHDEVDLGTRSCEEVAERLLENFNLLSCWVYEDGENGGGAEVC